MRSPVALLLGLGLLAAGCRSTEPVEAALRARENDVAQLRGEVSRLQASNDALQHELQDVRRGTSAKITPELAAQMYGVRGISLGLQTGGYDNDGRPGDEALQVVVEPEDPDGQVIKAPGTLQVEATEITPEGLKRPLSTWVVSPDELRRSWRSGLLCTAYFVVLPWQTWPTSDRLRVVARFTVADGRAFEAERDVVVHPPPPALRKSAPPPAGPEAPLPPSRRPDAPPPDVPAGPRLDPPPRPDAAARSAALSESAAGPAAQLLRPLRVP